MPKKGQLVCRALSGEIPARKTKVSDEKVFPNKPLLKWLFSKSLCVHFCPAALSCKKHLIYFRMPSNLSFSKLRKSGFVKLAVFFFFESISRLSLRGSYSFLRFHFYSISLVSVHHWSSLLSQKVSLHLAL